MNKTSKAELKHFYPIYKIILIVLDILLVVISVKGISTYGYRLHSISKSYQIMCIAFPVAAVILIILTVKYMATPLKSVPVVSKLISKKNLKQMIENENFEMLDDLKDGVIYKKFLVSKNWFCICDYFVPRNLIAMMWLDSEGMGTEHFYVYFMLITGDVFRIEYLIRDKSLKPDTPLVKRKTGVYATLMQALYEHTNGLGVSVDYCFYQKECIEKYKNIVLKMSMEYNVKANIENLIKNENDIQKMIADNLKQRVEASYHISDEDRKDETDYFITWTRLWNEDARYRQFIKKELLDKKY